MYGISFTCPHCGNVIEVAGSQAGATLPCPSCKEWLMAPSTEELAAAARPQRPAGPAASAPAAPPAPLPPRVHSSALRGGWSCLITAVALMYFLPEAHLVYLPLFAVAFILGIVAMAQGKAIGGQLILVLSLIVPVVVGVRFLGIDLPDWVQIPGLTSPRPVPEEPAPPEDAPSSLSEAAVPAAAANTPAATPRSAPAGDWRPGAVDSGEGTPVPDWSRPAPAETTDWEERLDYWFAQYAARFTPPAAGTRVTVTLLSGASNEGTLLNVEEDQITLQIPKGLLTFERDRLAETTRRQFFREDFARHFAQRRVQLDRERERAPAPPQPPPAPPKKPARDFRDFL